MEKASFFWGGLSLFFGWCDLKEPNLHLFLFIPPCPFICFFFFHLKPAISNFFIILLSVIYFFIFAIKTLMKCLEKKLDGNYMRMVCSFKQILRATPNKTTVATCLPSHKPCK